MLHQYKYHVTQYVQHTEMKLLTFAGQTFELYGIFVKKLKCIIKMRQMMCPTMNCNVMRKFTKMSLNKNSVYTAKL